VKPLRLSRHLPFIKNRDRRPRIVFEVLVPESYAPDLRRFLVAQGARPRLKTVRRILGRSRLTWLMPAPRPTAIFSVSTDELAVIDRLAQWYEQRRFQWPLLWVGIQPPDNGWRLDFSHATPGEIKQVVQVNNLRRQAAGPPQR
jgi:hypothetical protein